jgi:hypothetical protein
MLTQPLLDKLVQLRLPAFRDGLQEQERNPQYAQLSFEERLALLVDLECTRRHEHRIRNRIRAAGFPFPAQCTWIASHLNLLVLGPTGSGKSFVSAALGLAACRSDHSVRYFRTSRFLYQLAQSHLDGSYPALLASLARIDLIILDDWMRDPLTSAETRDLLEVFDDRFGRVSTLVASQVPVADWFARLPDPTLADSLLDRIIHNAHRINLKGDSQRKKRAAVSMPST